MTTLMMLKGWKLAFCSTSHNYTYCPDNFSEFLKQRRRWYLSDIFNQYIVLTNLWNLIRWNIAFSLFFSFYQVVYMICTIISAYMWILIICVELKIVTGVPLVYFSTVTMVILFAYVIVCMTCAEKVIFRMTMVLYGVTNITIMAIVIRRIVVLGLLAFSGEQLILIL